MKVGILAHNLLEIRGGVKLAITLGSKLKDAGHEVAYACAKEDFPALEKKFGMKLSFKVYRPKFTFLRDKLINISSLWNQGIPTYRLCREFKPDLVIEIGGVITPLLIPIAMKIPSIHYCYCPASLCAEFAEQKPGRMRKLYSALVGKIEAFTVRKTDKIISMCRLSQMLAKNLWGIESIYIFPPTNVNLLKPARKEKIILSVSCFTKSYHLEKLIEIFERIGKPGYILYILGQLNKSSPEDVTYFEHIKLLAEKKSNIVVDYHVDFNVLLNLYRKSKIFWYPYWMYFGLNIVDAQSCGTPSLAVRLPEKWGSNNGAAEVIKDNITGFMTDSVPEFYEKTLTLLNNPKLWAKMSRAARQNAVKNLGEDLFIKKFKKEIDSLARAKGIKSDS